MLRLRSSFYVLLTGIGFLIVLGVGIYVYLEFRSMAVSSGGVHAERFLEVYQRSLEDVDHYVRRHYPELTDTERLRREGEAGSEWFWNLSAEMAGIAQDFELAFVCVIEKEPDSGSFVFLLSSEIGKDKNPEWLHGPVWTGEIPEFVLRAWDTGEALFSPVGFMDEWGMLLGLHTPVMKDGKTAALIVFMYDLTGAGMLFQRQAEIDRHSVRFLRNARVILLVSILASLAIMITLMVLSRHASGQAEEAHRRMQSMLDVMAQACFFFDTQGQIVDCNRRAVEMFHARDREAIVDDFYRFSPPFQADGRPSREAAMDVIRRTMQSGKEVFFWEHITADGTSIPAEITLVRIPWDQEFRLLAYVKDMRDIAEKEDNLNRILSIVEGSFNLTIYIGGNGTVEYLSPSVPEVTGFSRDELFREKLRPLFNDENYRRLMDEYLPVVEAGDPINFEMNVLSRDGGEHEYYFSAFPAKLHGGKYGTGIQGHDIREIKETQRDLAATKERAESALKQEVFYNQAKNDFLSRVSHELRTPLNMIMGMIGPARSAENTEEREKSLDTIMEASGDLLEKINGIIDLTEVDTGNFSWSPVPFSLREIARQAENNIRARARSKTISFSSVIDPGIPDSVISDARRLRQVLVHLLSNAVKFTGPGGAVSLELSLLEKNRDFCRVRITVTDTGIGISKSARQRLWEVFEQADNSINRVYGGIGIGLPLAKRIVTMMNGTISVESEEGAGARFVCDVRFVLAENQEGGSLEPSPDDYAAAIPDLTGRKILVADDVEINRQILISLLEDSGADFDEAASGDEAVAKTAETGYDFIFMDLHMPGMDGIDAARAIRALDRPDAKTVPIVSVSADSSAVIMQRCAEAGITGSVTKPLDMESLFHALLKYLPA